MKKAATIVAAGILIESISAWVPIPTTLSLARDSIANAGTDLNNVNRRAFVSALGIAALTLGGASNEPALAALKEDGRGYDASLQRIYDTRVGSYLPPHPEQLFRRGKLPEAPVICLGEYHSAPLSHYAQYHTIVALHKAEPEKPLSIGLEMLYKQMQPALDSYVFEHGDFGRLKEEVSWRRTWGYDFNLYSKIFRYARINGLRLVGLNTPQALLSLVSQHGIAGLPQNLRELLPEMDLTVAAHRERFVDSMKGLEAFHGKLSPEVMDRFYEAQTLWEEHMADVAAKHIQQHGGRMVLLAGVTHIVNRDGIPDRIERRLKDRPPPFTVVPQNVDWDMSTKLPAVETPPGRGYADWVWYTENEYIGSA